MPAKAQYRSLESRNLESVIPTEAGIQQTWIPGQARNDVCVNGIGRKPASILAMKHPCG